MARKRSLGEGLEDHVADAMIAACALMAGLAVAARNENEFRNTGVKIVNPWLSKR
jgi:predicted nucleic acid-binding protein